MKKLILILLSWCIGVSAYCQPSDAAIKTSIDNNVRNITSQAGITKGNVADIMQALDDAKMNRVEYLVATGVNTYVLVANPTISSYKPGLWYPVKFRHGNTGAATISINGLAPKSLKKGSSTTLASGDILSGQAFIIYYDSTNFQMIGIGGSGGGGGSSAWGGITGTLSDQTDLNSALTGKQATLTSGTNIRTVNGNSLLGSGDIATTGLTGLSGDVTASGTSGTAAATVVKINGNTVPANASGVLTNNGSGTLTWGAAGGSGITALTGDVTASGTGSVAATVAKINGNTVPANASGVLTNNGSGTLTWAASGGTGTVTSASVVSANGLAGTVANATTTPALTLSTTVTGLLKGNGTAISAATAGTDYLSSTNNPTTTTGDLLVNNGGTLNRFATGNAGQILTSNGSGTLPTWSSNLSSGLAKINPLTTMLYFGDSFTLSQQASGTSSGYVAKSASAFNVTQTIIAQGGTGWFATAYKGYVNLPATGNSNPISVLAGYNEVRAAGGGATTLEKLKSSERAFIANAFLDTAVPASSSSVTKGGTWTSASTVGMEVSTSHNIDKSTNALSGTSVYATNTGNTLTYSFTGTNLIIGTFSTDEVTIFGGDFSWSIDGITTGSYSGKSKTDGQPDYAGYSGAIVPNAVVITGLASGSHTAIITTTSATKTIVDYFGTLRIPQVCPPIIIGSIPKMTAAGYAGTGSGLTPNLASDAVMNSGSDALKSVVTEFSSIGYPVYFYYNNRYNSNIPAHVDADNQHPNNYGYSDIALDLGAQVLASSNNNGIYSSWNDGNKNLSRIFNVGASNTGWLTQNLNASFIPDDINKTVAYMTITAGNGDSNFKWYTNSTNNSFSSVKMTLDKVGSLTANLSSTATAVLAPKGDASSLIANTAFIYQAINTGLTMSDNFNRANSSLNGQTPTFGTNTWVVTNALNIASNQLHNPNTGTPGYAAYDVRSYQQDVTITNVSPVSNAHNIFIYLGTGAAGGSGDYLYYDLYLGQFFQSVSSVVTSSIAGISCSSGGETVRVYRIGNFLAATINGVFSTNFNCNSSTTIQGTQFLLAISDNTTDVDNVVVYTAQTIARSDIGQTFYGDNILNGNTYIGPSIASFNFKFPLSGAPIFTPLATGGASQMVVANSTGVLGIQAIPSGDGMLAGANGADANFTATVNTAYFLPASTLTANRTITIPSGTAMNKIEFYNLEAGFSWLLAGAAVYLSDGTTALAQLLANTNYEIRYVNGQWRILN